MGPTIRQKLSRAFQRSSEESSRYRDSITVAIPRALNVYSSAPLLRTYLELVGIPSSQILFSGFTNEDMYLEGAKYGSIDPCFPAKVAQSHVYSLLFDRRFKRKDIDYIWFPTINNIDGFVEHTMGQAACPVVSGTPRVVYSTFTKESDLFEKAGVEYIDDTISLADEQMLYHQLYLTWGQRLKITEDESNWALSRAIEVAQKHRKSMQNLGKQILDDAESSGEVVILLLGRPYHSDKGINHDILDEFQSLGYKILSLDSIPKDREYLDRYFMDDIAMGYIESPLDIRDVWPENFSTNSAQKVWAAKFAARHKSVAVLDLSSFKCGHDAPTYSIIDNILGASRTPHLTLHDIDANKPGGSIKIRVKTFAYTLEQYGRALGSH